MFKIGRCSRCGKLKLLNVHGFCKMCNTIIEEEEEKNRIRENDNEEMDVLTKVALMDVLFDHHDCSDIKTNDKVDNEESFFEGGESGGGGASCSFESESDNSSNSNENGSYSSNNNSDDSFSTNSDYSDSGSSSFDSGSSSFDSGSSSFD